MTCKKHSMVSQLNLKLNKYGDTLSEEGGRGLHFRGFNQVGFEFVFVAFVSPTLVWRSLSCLWVKQRRLQRLFNSLLYFCRYQLVRQASCVRVDCQINTSG